jgi:hypothetical protein
MALFGLGVRSRGCLNRLAFRLAVAVAAMLTEWGRM